MLTLDIKGLNELILKYEKLPVTITREVQGIIIRGAQVWVRNAKRDAPVNFGVLRNSITYQPTGPLSVNVVSGAKYSPYMEWGTITRVRVPAELSSYAIQFKGRGIRKTGGNFPRPFFFKQLPIAKLEIEKGIQSIINAL